MSRSAVARPAMRAATSSASDAAGGGRPGRRHRPSCSTSRPSASAPTTNSRTCSTLPRLLSTMHASAFCSTGPPRPASINAAISSSGSAPRSTRRAPPSFHSATIASGHGSPARTVASTNAVPVVARCCTSVAEVGSRRCASSTPTTTGRPAARSRSAPAVPRRSDSVSSDRSPSASRPASAPSGSVAALRVACTQSTSAPSRSAAAIASRASRDLPTPAGPRSTTPSTSPARRTRLSRSSSSARPTSGQDLDDRRSGMAPCRL